ncbi:M20/M25/M40 family metallo-hydrolase [Aminithiophilus ramosus]|uniref:M20/M25/M40 family metallo-hydrolase n=2 Tax=Synergistales TaxID=649776 RepID=A0A9Q7AC83_9BACT|nr:M20/M25/M40 family metallo-hydrolase [Aminithiophilus ramosus]QTX32268.1 M20/M25/M40 family metallo-hydrolase [Aminithiophilus ramosus]QVL36135.1 M20/M25/M40 family metallo-hydrolase [Synergistota bacterium]
MERREKILELLFDLCRIPSVSPDAEGELAVVNLLRDRLAREPYFADSGGDLRLLDLENDPLERKALWALVRAEPPTEATILLMGHIDVVAPEPLADLQRLAFDPRAYTEALKEIVLPRKIDDDLRSGQWLFGRGVADMKGGVAVETILLAEASHRPATLPCNVALLVVPDEETSSLGMTGSLPHLVRLQEEGLRFLGCIDAEPTVTTGEGEEASIHLGSIGKINPFFLCLGRRAHVGEYYEGLSGALIGSHLNTILDGNADLTDRLDGVAYPGYASIWQRDLRPDYGATLADRQGLLYSRLTVDGLPSDLMEELTAAALEAQRRALSQIDASARSFSFHRPRPVTPPAGEPRVVRYETLLDQASAAGVDVTSLTETVLEKRKSEDPRLAALEIASALLDASGERGPLIVVGFLFPYYPHRINGGRSEGDRRMAAVAQAVAEAARSRFGRHLGLRPLFEGVSDLSYCGFSADRAELDLLARNVPGWGRLYRFPLEALASLDIPILNVGPLGRDAHKSTERVHLPYLLDELPSLLEVAMAEAAAFR